MNYPDDWEFTELKEIGDWKTGSTPRRSNDSYWGGDINWVSPKDMKTDRIVETKDKMTEKALNETNSEIIPPNSVIIVTRSGILDHSFPVAINEKPVTINQDLKAFIPSEEVNASYVYYYLRANEIDILKNCTKDGTTVASINSDSLYGYEIPIPPLIDQERIVARIEELFSKLDAGVDDLTILEKKVERFRRSILNKAVEGGVTRNWRKNSEYTEVEDLLRKLKDEKDELTGRYQHNDPIDYDRNDIPSDWKFVRLSEISKNIQYGYTESAKEKVIGPKFLRISDIQDGQVDWENTPYCEIEEGKKEDYLLEENDLLFARTGGTVGKSFLIGEEPPEAVFASYLIRIKLKKNIFPEFVYTFFRSGYYWRQIHEGKVGVGQPNVNATKLSRIVLPLPPYEEQLEIVNRVNKALSIISSVGNTIIEENQRAERLRIAILQKMFEDSQDATRDNSSRYKSANGNQTENDLEQKTLKEVSQDAK